MVISATILNGALASLALAIAFLAFPGRTRPVGRRFAFAALGISTFVAVAFAARISLSAIRTPPLWDFICFRAYALAAAGYHDPYSAAALIAVTRGMSLPVSFIRETLSPGMPYPPPSVLMFLPLALGSTHTAALGWWFALVAALIVLTMLVIRKYFAGGALCALAATTIVWAFPPVLETLAIGQTMIFATLAVALFLLDENAARCGLWLTLAILAKPLIIVVVLYSIIRKEMGTLAVFAVTLAIACATSLLVISPASFASYFLANPVNRVPGSLYRETAYQSLFSFFLRMSGDTSAHYRLYEQYPFVAVAIVLTAVSLGLCLTLATQERPIAVSLLICTALIVYPGTLYFYGILMLIPMFVCWGMRDVLPGGTATVLVFWTVETLFQALGMHGAFWGFVCGWVFFAVLILWRVRDRTGVNRRGSPRATELAS